MLGSTKPGNENDAPSVFNVLNDLYGKFGFGIFFEFRKHFGISKNVYMIFLAGCSEPTPEIIYGKRSFVGISKPPPEICTNCQEVVHISHPQLTLNKNSHHSTPQHTTTPRQTDTNTTNTSPYSPANPSPSPSLHRLYTSRIRPEPLHDR